MASRPKNYYTIWDSSRENWAMSQKYFRSGVGFPLSFMEVFTENLIEHLY